MWENHSKKYHWYMNARCAANNGYFYAPYIPTFFIKENEKDNV